MKKIWPRKELFDGAQVSIDPEDGFLDIIEDGAKVILSPEEIDELITFLKENRNTWEQFLDKKAG